MEFHVLTHLPKSVMNVTCNKLKVVEKRDDLKEADGALGSQISCFTESPVKMV